MWYDPRFAHSLLQHRRLDANSSTSKQAEERGLRRAILEQTNIDIVVWMAADILKEGARPAEIDQDWATSWATRSRGERAAAARLGERDRPGGRNPGTRVQKGGSRAFAGKRRRTEGGF